MTRISHRPKGGAVPFIADEEGRHETAGLTTPPAKRPIRAALFLERTAAPEGDKALSWQGMMDIFSSLWCS
jgi:hypothetical protein